MQVTYETKIGDKSLYPVLEAYASLYGRVERALFRDLYCRRSPLNELKQLYQPRFGITARQFNSVRTFLDGKVSACRESRKLQVATLKDKVQSCEKAVKELEKKLTQLHKKFQTGKEAPEEIGVIAKTRTRLHNKKRRLAILLCRLATATKELMRPVPRLTFGSNKLFRAQFHLAENGFASHHEWLQAWRGSRSNQFVCIGSKDETVGNQSCTYSPDSSTLRLRLPNALIPDDSREKYFNITGIHFEYGSDVIAAAIASGKQALTFRFIRRPDKTRSGKEIANSYSWYVQVTTERIAAKRVTDRRLGAIGIDLNPALIATATIDRYGNPIATEHFPVQLQKRRSEQVAATLSDVVADIVLQAQAQQLPIVIEKLDFTKKKAELREKSNHYARMLSAFAYKKFYDLLHSRASRCGVEVLEVNPAFTSVIGTVKFKSGYGISTHAAAAIAIARRGLRFGEALRTRGKPVSNPTKNALPLPARNKVKHIWSDWRKVSQRLRTLKTQIFKVRGRPSSEETLGSPIIGLSCQNHRMSKPTFALWL